MCEDPGERGNSCGRSQQARTRNNGAQTDCMSQWGAGSEDPETGGGVQGSPPPPILSLGILCTPTRSN